MAKWKEKRVLSPEIVLEKIYSNFKGGKNTSILYHGYEFGSGIAVLTNMIDFGNKLDGIDVFEIVKKAVINIGKFSRTIKKQLIDEVNILIKKELSKRNTEYYILSSISVDPKEFRGNYQVGNSKIEILENDFPSKFSDRKTVIKNNRDYFPNKEVDYYAKVIITVSAKSNSEAVNKAIYDLDSFRSLLCLFGNYEMSESANIYKPINRILPCGIHTAHDCDGTATSNEVWFESISYSVTNFKSQNKEVNLKNLNWAISRLEKSPYKQKLIRSMNIFVKAFDEIDPNFAFIRLWGAFEGLLLSNNSLGNNDSIPSRCAFLFEEHPYHTQVLEHLREYRNNNIHNGHRSERSRVFCYQLQFYFKKLILFLLHNKFEFENLIDAHKFLDMPKEPNDLLKLSKRIENANKFLGIN